jgi:hypothetical protein
MMMEVEIVSETLGFYLQLTLLVAQENFIKANLLILNEKALK